MSASFAHWPTHLRVIVAFKILGVFIYALSIPVHSSLSIEFSSKLFLSRRTPSCTSNSFSTRKSTRSSYIWNISTWHWDGKKATFAQSAFPLQMQYFMHIFSRPFWIHGITITPTTNLNIWKTPWQNHFGKSIGDQHEVHFLVVRWNNDTNLCSVIWFAC